jgi:hypothetical protein
MLQLSIVWIFINCKVKETTCVKYSADKKWLTAFKILTSNKCQEKNKLGAMMSASINKI